MGKKKHKKKHKKLTQPLIDLGFIQANIFKTLVNMETPKTEQEYKQAMKLINTYENIRKDMDSNVALLKNYAKAIEEKIYFEK